MRKILFIQIERDEEVHAVYREISNETLRNSSHTVDGAKESKLHASKSASGEGTNLQEGAAAPRVRPEESQRRKLKLKERYTQV